MSKCNGDCTTNCCKVRRGNNLVTLNKRCNASRSSVIFRWSTAGDAYRNNNRRNCCRGSSAKFATMW